ncbi:MAG: DUF1822 family protein [Phormidesmis sp.]
MVGKIMETTNLRLQLPETLWLEPEHFTEAKSISAGIDSVSAHSDRESQQWQTYINALALLAFEVWLKEKLPDSDVRAIAPSLIPTPHSTNRSVSYLSVDGFRLCILATEHVLDEQISLPTTAVEQAELAAHCYVVLEVLEEQAQAITRGFLAYDELIAQLNRIVIPAAERSSEYALLPLSALDAELNHLLACVRYSHPSKISLPASLPISSAATSSQPSEVTSVDNRLTRLGQWLQGTLSEGWQAVEQLVNPTANLAWSTRDTGSAIKGGKLINLGVQLGRHPVVLLIAVTPEAEGKIGINVQVFPTGSNTVLPPQLTVALLSSTDGVLQAVTSRAQDSYIQLRTFKGRAGIRFSLAVSLNDIAVKEAFEL